MIIEAKFTEVNHELNANFGVVAVGIDEAYKDGYADGQAGMWDEIKSTASGNPIRIDDISPIEHEMSVKVSGVEDLSAVKVKAQGKNLYNIRECDYGSATFTKNGFTADIMGDGQIHLYGKALDTSSYTVLRFPIKYSMRILYPAGTFIGWCKNNNTIYTQFGMRNPNGSGIFNIQQGAKTTTEPRVLEYMTIVINENYAETINEIIPTQLEYGTTATDYEPYIEPVTYTADENGIVSGVMSLYPCTTLITDTDGAIIEATYNQDIGKVDDVPEMIDAVYGNGVENGKTDKDREMWDCITNYNARTDYEKGFSAWGSEYIRPPYKISPTARNSANQTFVNCPTLKKIEAQYFDFSQKLKGNTNIYSQHYTFYNCQLLEEIEDIKLQADFGLYATYANCIKLKKIAVVRADENTVIEETFNFCKALEEVRFEGVIGRNGLDMHWSPLTHESLMSIINCLKDYSTDTSGTSHTVTLGQTNLDKLTSDEKAIATQKGWSLG